MHLLVLTPTSNSSEFFLECLNCVNSLSATRLVIRVIDNLSNDSTLDTLLDFTSPKATLSYISQKDTGPAQALNTGFQLALSDPSVDIVGWLNSDDYYAPGAIDRALATFAADPKLKIVYGLGSHVDESGKDLGAYPTLGPDLAMKDFALGSPICQPTVFFRKEVFAEVGLLDESLKTAFDFDFWFRIFKKYKRSQIGFINQVQAYSRLHSQCLTKRLRQTVALESMQVISRYLGSAPAHWLLTYFDEICERYPFVEEKSSLVEVVKEVLLKAKPYMKASDLAKLVKEMQSDWRLRLSHQQAFANVQPDSWVTKRLVVKLRYSNKGPKTVQLQCRGGWPTEGNLTISITSADGSIEKVKLGTQDEFILNLEAPDTPTEAFTAWVIETKQTFVPAKTIKKSKDNRKLSFKVEALKVI